MKTPEERAYAFVEQYAQGVDRNTFGFNAWEFKDWLADCIKEAITEAVADEREECVKIAEKLLRQYEHTSFGTYDDWKDGARDAFQHTIEFIRARGNA